MTNPYENLPSEAFWRPAVADRNMFEIDNLWKPKFNINKTDKIVAFGSCFAQNITKEISTRGYNWHITENPPWGFSEDNCKKFNYNIFSARTGNIYTTSLLRQWTEWALGKKKVPDEIWKNKDHFIDPFRPNIEPDGFGDEDELRRSQAYSIHCFYRCIKEADYFIFTLGLTESWINKKGEYEYPMCPGTIAGEFSNENHEFVNLYFEDVRSNLAQAMKLMIEANPNLKFIFTVSPVPLTATYSNKHVILATMYSKSILRSVVGQISANWNNVDYFPSYEFFNSPVFKGTFFQPNQRNVNSHGVKIVMDLFFSSIEKNRDIISTKNSTNQTFQKSKNDTVCEEEILEAFAK